MIRTSHLVTVALAGMTTMLPTATALRAGETAPTEFISMVQPCAQPLRAAAAHNEEEWIRQCAQTQQRTRGVAPNAFDVCRRWLAACRRDPRHPLPSSTTSY